MTSINNIGLRTSYQVNHKIVKNPLLELQPGVFQINKATIKIKASDSLYIIVDKINKHLATTGIEAKIIESGVRQQLILESKERRVDIIDYDGVFCNFIKRKKDIGSDDSCTIQIIRANPSKKYDIEINYTTKKRFNNNIRHMPLLCEHSNAAIFNIIRNNNVLGQANEQEVVKGELATFLNPDLLQGRADIMSQIDEADDEKEDMPPSLWEGDLEYLIDKQQSSNGLRQAPAVIDDEENPSRFITPPKKKNLKPPHSKEKELKSSSSEKYKGLHKGDGQIHETVKSKIVYIKANKNHIPKAFTEIHEYKKFVFYINSSNEPWKPEYAEILDNFYREVKSEVEKEEEKLRSYLAEQRTQSLADKQKKVSSRKSPALITGV